MVEYDVVVVGAGAAGCVVAARLAEAGRSVLLLEAGPDLRAEVPEDFRDGWSFPRRHEWGFESEPEGGRGPQPLRRGKLVGGTSWVTRFAVRGSPVDFDRWVASGCDGWGYDDVLPWFRRVETDRELGDRPWHGDSGPMPVTRYPHLPPSELAVAAADACEAIGIARIDDHNAPGAVGVGRMPMTSRDGMRVTTADAYLPTGERLPTLTLRADTHVDAVVVHSGRATGVRLTDGEVVGAARVVVCAGVYGSPTILQRSGIGPADHLRAVGVEVAVDLPGVGSNLADHPQAYIDPGYRGAAHDGPQLHTLATFSSSLAAPGDPPDLAFWIADPTSDPPDIEVLLMTPASRGSVRLRSASAADPPAIRLPRLDAPGDYERLAEGLSRAVELAHQPAMRRLCTGDPTPLDSPEQMRSWVDAERYSIPHTVGTCAMGTGADAVVDRNGDVHGVDGLSVVDASVIPVPPSGFPHIVTIMLAERIAAGISARG